MAFRLNDFHKAKPPGKYHRGKRTIAKEKLYKHLRYYTSHVERRASLKQDFIQKFRSDAIWVMNKKKNSLKLVAIDFEENQNIDTCQP